MDKNYFTHMPAEGVQVLQEAAKHISKGWNSTEYQASYLTFTEYLKGDMVTRDKFDALVRYWDTSDKNSKDWNYIKNRNGYSRVPNKMMTGKNTSHKSLNYGKDASEKWQKDVWIDFARSELKSSAPNTSNRKELFATYKGQIYKIKSKRLGL